VALKDITLKVKKGQRVGIIGANGAGKTTLLKLLCGNIVPTSGDVSVSGEIQALMGMGTGFHPEYTGRENAEASLQYNGLSSENYQTALEGVIEFSELGVFLDQPFKTYSLGMQARLMFATATAIKPEILIVDEVLGAGDAYFVAKSKIRVDELVNSGCTMLLVSHSMAQILELCTDVLWMEKGTVRMFGNAFDVVKAYEEFVYGSTSVLQGVSLPMKNDDVKISDGAESDGTLEPVKEDELSDEAESSAKFESVEEDELCDEAEQTGKAHSLYDAESGELFKSSAELKPRIELELSNVGASLGDSALNAGPAGHLSGTDRLAEKVAPHVGEEGSPHIDDLLFQEPYFVPHDRKMNFPDIEIPYGFNFINRSGISRWEASKKGLKICSFTMMTENGFTNKLLTLRPVKFIFEIKSEIEEDFSLRYSLNISNHLGQTVAAIRSPHDQFSIKSNETRLIEVAFNPMQLGPGDYIAGVAVMSYSTLEVINSATRYDLLSRSFDFTIENPGSMSLLQSQFFHSAEWLFRKR